LWRSGEQNLQDANLNSKRPRSPTAIGLHATEYRNATARREARRFIEIASSAEKAEMERRWLSLVHELRSQLAVKSADSQISADGNVFARFIPLAHQEADRCAG
jgi:hypothetical protein